MGLIYPIPVLYQLLMTAANLPAQDFAGHSYRTGAATIAAMVGIKDSTIQTFSDGRVLLITCTSGWIPSTYHPNIYKGADSLSSWL